jgi:D-amino-acid dehydrogenase
MSKTGTLIVGGGVIGVCTAYFLAKRGEVVTLLERDEIGKAASFGNAGLISVGHPPIPRPGLLWKAFKWMFDSTSPLYIAPRIDPSLAAWLWRFRAACRPDHFARSMKLLGKLGHATIPLYDELIEGLSIECDHRKTGVMEVYRTPQGKQQGEADGQMLSELGFQVKMLDAGGLREHRPAIQGDAMGAVWYLEHATCNPHAFVSGMAEHAAKAGATLRLHTEAIGFETSDGRVKGVRTPNEVIEAESVVLAAGSWSTGLARSVGVSVPMQPAKGYHLDLEHPTNGLDGACILIEEKVACTPMFDVLRLAGTLEFSGLNLDLRQERLAMLTSAASRYFPGIERAGVRSEWCGLRPCTADGLPVVGWAPKLGNLFVATGHAMLGLGLGPITGKLASEAILDRKPSVDISLLRADRF